MGAERGGEVREGGGEGRGRCWQFPGLGLEGQGFGPDPAGQCGGEGDVFAPIRAEVSSHRYHITHKSMGFEIWRGSSAAMAIYLNCER